MSNAITRSTDLHRPDLRGLGGDFNRTPDGRLNESRTSVRLNFGPDTYEGPRSTDPRAQGSSGSDGFQLTRLDANAWAASSSGAPGGERAGNPLSPNIREAFPELSLDRRSPDYEAQVRKVIAGDILAAGGRVATEEDYAYWVPKFLGPCDSSLVTSGQMTAEDYWHKRLLGMGAGGADAAKFGPYAGGDGSAGGAGGADFGGLSLSEGDFETILSYLRSLGFDIPARATSGGGGGGGGGNVVGFNPRAPKINEAFPQLSLDPRSPDYVDQIKKVIAGDIMTSSHRVANEGDYSYWVPKFLGPNDSSMVTSGQMSANEYWHQRLLGMGNGVEDPVKFGPYAQ